VKRHPSSNPCRIFVIFSTLSLCSCSLRHRLYAYISLVLSPCSTAVFALDCYSHWMTTLAVRWFCRTGHSLLASADASYLLNPIKGLLHVGLKPSIYSCTTRLWTQCTQPGDCLSHSPFQQTWNVCTRCCRTFFVRNAYASPACRCSKSGNFYRRKFPCRKISMQDWSLHALSFVRTLWTGYCELPESAVAL